MQIVYLSNFFNHHQKPVADALYGILGDNYSFVECWDGIPEEQKKLGYHEYIVPYVKKYSLQTDFIDNLIMEADVVIYGEAPLKIIKNRICAGKLTFRDDECRYRNFLRFLKWPIYTYNSLFLNKGYLLAASAYGPIDYLLSGMDPHRCFRWGYFPMIKQYDSVDSLMKSKAKVNEKVRILWCGRLITLKHPESVVYVAEHLKANDYKFELSIIGTGPLENKLKKLVFKKNLNDCITFHGSMKPEDVLDHMGEADIFLFTSDRNEGWGAVLNESMSNGCAVIAGSNIGSVPYLIKDGENGLVFRDKDWSDLYIKVKYLIDNPLKRRQMGEHAFKTMKEKWNGKVAANNLIMLCKALLNGKETPITEGPCSKAPLLMRKWHGKIKML